MAVVRKKAVEVTTGENQTIVEIGPKETTLHLANVGFAGETVARELVINVN